MLMMKLGAAALAVPFAAATMVAGTALKSGVLMVDVRESGHHFVVPVPLGLAHMALGFVPQDKIQLHTEIAPENAQLARKLVAALADAPDGELVRVEQDDQQVVIAKKGGVLRLDVKQADQDVHLELPLSAALLLMPKDGRNIEPAALSAALDTLRFTDLLEVRTAKEQVKVWVF
jgi:hypothetical protein